METRKVDRVAYFNEKYREVVNLPFRGKCVKLKDHADEASRRCRFCGLGTPSVTFRSDAHAVPEFLGNKAIISLNECDTCNTRLADHYEDHLSKWSLFIRALAQVVGKRGSPTFKNPGSTFRVSKGREIHLTDPAAKTEIEKQEGWFSLTLPADATSQPYIPVRAALALVRMACSVCPVELLPECQTSIDWLMGRLNGAVKPFTVLLTFTPGPALHDTDRIVLLQRNVDEPIPYFYVVVSFANIQLQTFIPGCLSDSWLAKDQTRKVEFVHYPIGLPTPWIFGPPEQSVGDWSGTEPTKRNMNATLNLKKAKVVRPEEE